MRKDHPFPLTKPAGHQKRHFFEPGVRKLQSGSHLQGAPLLPDRTKSANGSASEADTMNGADSIRTSSAKPLKAENPRAILAYWLSNDKIELDRIYDQLNSSLISTSTRSWVWMEHVLVSLAWNRYLRL
jgi:hypothetical protein